MAVSTDPAHSLSDSLAQDVTGGTPVMVDGTDAMLYAMEVDPEQAKAEFAAFAKQSDMTGGAKDFMSSVGKGWHSTPGRGVRLVTRTVSACHIN